MAYKIKINTPYGVSCDYWIIDRIEKSKTAQTAFIILYGYPSKKAKDKGASFLERRFINIYPKDYNDVFGIDELSREGSNDYKKAYEFIKAHFEEFKNAEDV